MATFLNVFLSTGGYLPPDEIKERFDSNCITPVSGIRIRFQFIVKVKAVVVANFSVIELLSVLSVFCTLGKNSQRKFCSIVGHFVFF